VGLGLRRVPFGVRQLVEDEGEGAVLQKARSTARLLCPLGDRGPPTEVEIRLWKPIVCRWAWQGACSARSIHEAIGAGPAL